MEYQVKEGHRVLNFDLYASPDLYKRIEPFIKSETEYVYKKCRTEMKQEYFVVLQKQQDDFQCNELRSGIKDKCLAKFRCNKLIPVFIYNLSQKMEETAISHFTVLAHRILLTVYEKGILVRPTIFSIFLEDVCAPGIHYFLHPTPALLYDCENGVVRFKNADVFSSGGVYLL